MNRADRPYRRRMAWVYVPFLLFGLFVATYSAYWFWMRGQLAKGIEDWIDAERANGATIAYTDKRLHGFPYRFALTVADPVYTLPNEELAWRGDELQLAMQPWNFRHIIARAQGRNELTTQNGDQASLIIRGRSALSLRWDSEALTTTVLALDEADLVTDQGAVGLDGISVHIANPDGRPNDIRFAMDWNTITLPQAPQAAPWLGQSLQDGRIRIDLIEVLPALLSLDTISYREVSKTRANLAQIVINWGALHLGLKGELGLDEELAPTGTLSIRLEEVETLKKHLETAGWLTQEVDQILSAMEAASASNGFLPISFRDGGAYFLGQRLFDIRPEDFNENNYP